MTEGCKYIATHKLQAFIYMINTDASDVGRSESSETYLRYILNSPISKGLNL